MATGNAGRRIGKRDMPQEKKDARQAGPQEHRN